MLSDFLIPFITIGISELGDKTQLAVMALAAKTKKPLPLFSGAMLGFLVADGLAILLGTFLTKLIPEYYIKILAGIIFIIVGILAIIKKEGNERTQELKNPFLAGFVLVVISEMGDKTQIAAGLFATQFNPWLVFIAVLAALSLTTGLSIVLGKAISKVLSEKHISLISGILFLS